MTHMEKKEGVSLFNRALDGERGIYAKKQFFVGQVIFSGKAEKIEKIRGKYTIQHGSSHILIDLIGRSVNHSCSPNAKFSWVNGNDYLYTAIKHINEGDEIYFDYTSTETEFSSPFKCFCGSENCRNHIGLVVEEK